MHHTIGRIVGQIHDYKMCKECGSENWYENETCVNCDCKKFRKMTQKDADSLLDGYKDLNIDSMEKDV